MGLQKTKIFKVEKIYFSLNKTMGTSIPPHRKLRIFTLIFKKDMIKPNKLETSSWISIPLQSPYDDTVVVQKTGFAYSDTRMSSTGYFYCLQL